MYKIEKELALEALHECIELGAAQYEEIEGDRVGIEYAPNYKLFDLLHGYGAISLITARKDGELVGYVATLFSEGLFSQGIEAREIGIYVKPECRGSSVFYRMMKEVEKDLKASGVRVHYILFKKGHDKGFAERLGYQMTETAYQKILGD